jgi:hypothetical protein
LFDLPLFAMGERLCGHHGKHIAIACSLLAVPPPARKKQISRADHRSSPCQDLRMRVLWYQRKERS